MTQTVVRPGRPASRFDLVRRLVGFIVLAAVAAAGVLFVLGTWNPWQLVALKYSWFGNPMLGLLTVPAAALVGMWLAFPVRNEAVQRGRIVPRAVAGVLAVAGLFGWGVLGDHFSFDVDEAVRSGDGSRAAALVSDRGEPPTSYVRIWQGTGVTTREVGDLGRVCGSVSLRFVAEDRLAVETAYGSWQVELDPVTGAPRQVLGPGCADGPVPR